MSLLLESLKTSWSEDPVLRHARKRGRLLNAHISALTIMALTREGTTLLSTNHDDDEPSVPQCSLLRGISLEKREATCALTRV